MNVLKDSLTMYSGTEWYGNQECHAGRNVELLQVANHEAASRFLLMTLTSSQHRPGEEDDLEREREREVS